MIRVATELDIHDIAVLGKRFWNEHHYSKFSAYDEEKTHNSLLAFHESEQVVILVYEDDNGISGFLALGAVDVPWSNLKTCAEMLWWVAPEARGSNAGKELMNAGKVWAQVQGCKLIEAHNTSGKRIVIHV